ncbi:MAG: site-2 protease family protein [candidate division Zixibacteria bacterium]|nr:site-2 protease family protein [candidate division Zixibacteria bacterium]
MVDQNDIARVVAEKLPPGFSVTAVGQIRRVTVIRIEGVDIGAQLDIRSLLSALEEESLDASWNRDSTGATLLRIKRGSKSKIPWKHLILFLVTVLTVLIFPSYYRYLFLVSTESTIAAPVGLLDWISRSELWDIGWGLNFAGWLMGILLAHEFGHYFAGVRRKIKVTLPFFIPAPTQLGTFGAVIRFKSPIENRRDLIEVGAAGPIAGFIVAVIAVWIGLLQTDPTSRGLFSFEYESILMSFLGDMMFGDSLGPSVDLAPAAFAGWVGLLVTALNLLPISQLDGGHIVYGMFGKKQRLVAYFTMAGLFLAGFYWPGWWFYGFLAVFFGPFHGPTLDDQIPVSSNAKVMGWISIIIFALTLNLRPFG